MIILDGSLHKRLRERVIEEKTSREDHILRGAAQSIEDYKARCEVLRILDNVIEWMDEIQSAINRGD